MENEKTLNNSSNKVIELPNEYNIPTENIIIPKINPIEKDDLWQIFLYGVNGFTDDFFVMDVKNI